MANNNEITTFETIDKEKVKSQIYEIRGCKVMLDSDIALYFNVETKTLNRAMKRNIKRFPDSFCFQLTVEESSRCQIGTLKTGRGSNTKYLPYAYTEQGIAMLTSCLRTDRAIHASIQIIDAFVQMRHYIQENKQLFPYKDLYLLSNRQDIIEKDIKEIKDSVVTKDDIPEFMKLFDNNIINQEILILNGQPFKADLAYQQIFTSAKSTIFIIDDYIGIKTLQHLRKIAVAITVFTDNKQKHLSHQECVDFVTEYPDVTIYFKKTRNKIHDRYIIVDYNSKNAQAWHLGSSIKDSGNKVTTINKFKDVKLVYPVIEMLLKNPDIII